MSLIIKKFGGTSVADIDNIKNVAAIIKEAIDRNERVVAVVSAMAGATNSLISKCSSVSNLATKSQLREYDASVSSGEIITASLLALQLDSIGVKARSLQGWQVPIKTDGNVSNALVQEIPTEKIEQMLAEGYTPVITGFQGVTPEHDVSTLGKGGSDTTAALLASALGASRCDIYTDVDGVYSADPNLIPDAKKIDEIDAHSMLRLSELGAKVLHKRAAHAAVQYGLNMRILSSFTKGKGTSIVKEVEIPIEGCKVLAVTGNRNILDITIELASEDFTNSESSVGSKYDSFMMALIDSELEYKSIHMTSSELQKRGDRSQSRKLCLRANLSDQQRFTALLAECKNQQLIANYEYNSDIATLSLIGYGINNVMRKTTQSTTQEGSTGSYSTEIGGSVGGGLEKSAIEAGSDTEVEGGVTEASSVTKVVRGAIGAEGAVRLQSRILQLLIASQIEVYSIEVTATDLTMTIGDFDLDRALKILHQEVICP